MGYQDFSGGVGMGTPMPGQYGQGQQYGAPEQRYQQPQQQQGQPWYQDMYAGLRDMFGLQQQQPQQQPQQPTYPQGNDPGNPNISLPQFQNIFNLTNQKNLATGEQLPNDMASLRQRAQVMSPQRPPEEPSLMSRFSDRFQSGIGNLRDLGGNIRQSIGNFRQNAGGAMDYMKGLFNRVRGG
jgi:hypothetical protein